MPRRYLRTASGVCTVALVAGCGGQGATNATGADCVEVTPASNPATVTRLIDLGDAVTLTTTRRQDRLVTARAVSSKGIDDLVTEFQKELAGSTWTVIQVDNEGFEAELYLSGASGELGVVKIRETGCPGQTSVSITVNLG